MPVVYVEAGIARPAHHVFDELDALGVGRMGLAGHDEHGGTLGIVEQAGQTVGIGKEHGGTLVGSEAAGKADDESAQGDKIMSVTTNELEHNYLAPAFGINESTNPRK